MILLPFRYLEVLLKAESWTLLLADGKPRADRLKFKAATAVSE